MCGHSFFQAFFCDRIFESQKYFYFTNKVVFYTYFINIILMPLNPPSLFSHSHSFALKKKTFFIQENETFKYGGGYFGIHMIFSFFKNQYHPLFHLEENSEQVLAKFIDFTFFVIIIFLNFQ